MGLEELAEARAFVQLLEQEAAALSADVDISVQEAVRRLLDARGTTGQARRHQAFGAEILTIEVDYAAPVDQISLRSLISEAFPGDDRVPCGGYGPMVTALADGLDIRLGQQVERIEQSYHGVWVHTASGSYGGTHVVVTVPLGVLKAGDLMFEPPLSAAKQAALSRLDMANLEKVVLQFEEAFWAEQGSAFALIDDAVTGAWPIFIDFTAHVGTPTLACLAGGRFVRRAWAHTSNEALIAGALRHLAMMLGQDEVPLPRGAEVTRWREDPWCRGSYSYVPVGGSYQDHAALAEPEGRVRFAGEHTAGKAASTVHGAMMSGLREAQRLLDLRAPAALPNPHPPVVWWPPPHQCRTQG